MSSKDAGTKVEAELKDLNGQNQEHDIQEKNERAEFLIEESRRRWQVSIVIHDVNWVVYNLLNRVWFNIIEIWKLLYW